MMKCPKCKTKLMVDGKKDKKIFNMRCIKCGSEFFVDKGVIKQKKSLRIKKLPKGVTITKFNGKIDDNVKKQRAIVKQAEMVKRLNETARNIRRNKL